MRCKNHPTDRSSSVGVCASCLRQRLLSLTAAQAESQQRLLTPSHHHHHHHHPSPLIFPRSVSPYVARRKSDRTTSDHHLFYSTPQVDPTTSSATVDFSSTRSFKKKTRFSLLSNLFRSKSEKLDCHPVDFNPRLSFRDSCNAATSSSSPPPPSWISTIFTGPRRREPTVCYIEDVIARDNGRRVDAVDRGMSPAEDDDCEPPSTSYEVSPARWKRTPAAMRRPWAANVRNLSICLSPLVRPSPNRHHHRRQKGVPPLDLAYSGEFRGVAAKPQLSTAASFCANRSRKLADFGRVNHNR